MKVIKRGDPEYPKSLEDVYDPPEQLFCLGNTALLNSKMAAVVGSRKCSEYGKKTAMNIGKALSRANITVVSGMAKGIDSFAHLGALRNGGKTIAVFGNGPDICYPKENQKLYDQIISEGLVISEYPPGTKPMPFMFPRRNRIIAALAEGLAVVEAGTESGSLITVADAHDLGRKVFSVPGNISSECSLGTNKLIADGIPPLVVIEDFVRELGGPSEFNEDFFPELGETERELIRLLKENGEVSIEFLCSKLGKTPIDIHGIVTVLEIKGIVCCYFGKVFIANY